MGERAEKVAEGAALESEDLLSVLKTRIEALVGRHQDTKQQLATLKQEVAAKDEELKELRSQLKQADKLRADARRRVQDLVAKVDQLREADTTSARTAHA